MQKAPSEDDILNACSSAGSHIAVFLWKVGKVPHARFFQQRSADVYPQEILRCGSGTLAVARYLSEHSVLPVRLATAAGDLDVYAYDDGFAYRSKFFEPHLALQGTAFWQRGMNAEIDYVALLGAQTDYVLVSLVSEQALRSLRINWRFWRHATRRALIATAPSSRPGIDYGLRYFAPRYAAREDAATGSANAAAALYWSRRTGRRHLRVHQYSPEGGRIQLQLDDGGVWVRGRCHVLEPNDGA